MLNVCQVLKFDSNFPSNIWQSFRIAFFVNYPFPVMQNEKKKVVGNGEGRKKQKISDKNPCTKKQIKFILNLKWNFASHTQY